VQYPVNNCSTFQAGAPAIVFTCAIRGAGTKHNGQCPNGDANLGGKCQVPVDTANNTSQCIAAKATVPSVKVRATVTAADGRAYNLQLRDGTVAPSTIGYAKETIPTATAALSLDFAGAYNRNHQVQTIPANLGGCKLKDATDQIGCFVHADRCSIGFAGAAATVWHDRNPTPIASSDNGALLVNNVSPTAANVQKLGNSNAYPMSRKLYMSSLVGFGAASVTADELALAKWEAVPGNINPVLTAEDFFTLGADSPAGTDTPFCEDFNEETVCQAAAGTNVNGCLSNPAGLPNTAPVTTSCGNGVTDKFEECDPTAAQGTWTCSVPGATVCSSTCRC
jgi:hypothetical protein